MPRKPTKVGESRQTLTIGNLNIPVQIITEMGRNNTRAAITNQALIIRLPHFLNGSERIEHIANMLQWARDTCQQKPAAFAHFAKVPDSGQYQFRIRELDYRISVEAHDLGFHRVVPTAPAELLVTVNPEDGRVDGGKMLTKLLAKHFGEVFLPSVAERVAELNEQHFRRPINEVKMSDTYSRWGSCSHRGNINLATRLLLAPPEVLDAVIIHELAHLVEANHSARFWAQVERALPNYREYDAWLRTHGKKLLFKPTPV